jgi:hypothetical protein
MSTADVPMNRVVLNQYFSKSPHIFYAVNQKKCDDFQQTFIRGPLRRLFQAVNISDVRSPTFIPSLVARLVARRTLFNVSTYCHPPTPSLHLSLSFPSASPQFTLGLPSVYPQSPLNFPSTSPRRPLKFPSTSTQHPCFAPNLRTHS